MSAIDALKVGGALVLTALVVFLAARRLFRARTVQLPEAFPKSGTQDKDAGKRITGSTETVRILTELSQAMASSLNVDTTMGAIFSSINKLIPSDGMEMTLWDEAEQVLIPYRYTPSTEPPLIFEKAPLRYKIDEGYSGYLYTSHVPLLIREVNTFHDLQPAGDIFDRGLHSYIGVPLILGSECIGTIELACIAPDAFTPAHLELLRLLAGQAAIALHNAARYEEARRRTTELSTLAQMPQAFGVFEDSRELYSRLIRFLAPLIPTHILGILLFNEGLGCFEPQRPFQGIAEEVFSDEVFHGDIQLSPVAYQALKDQDVLISENACEDPHWTELGYDRFAQQAGLKDVVMAPLVSAGRTLGYLLAANHKSKLTGLSRDELHLLLIIANQVAPMIENANLFQQSRQRAQTAEALRKIASLASSAEDLDVILQTSMEELVRLSNASLGAILLVDESQRGLHLHRPSVAGSRDSIPEWANEIRSDHPLYSTAVTTTLDPLLVEKVDLAQANIQVYLPLLRAMRLESVVIVPLIVRNQGIGELWLGSERTAAFHHGHVDMALTASGQLAGVIERSRLFAQTDESLRRRVELFTGLTLISRELNTSLDPKYLLQMVYAETVRTTGADCGSILLLEWENPEDSQPAIKYVFGDGHSPDLSEVEQAAIIHGQSLPVADFSDTPWLPAHANVLSALLVPITSRGRVSGLIHLHSSHLAHFDQTALEITEVLALQASAVLNNAFLYQEQIRRGELLDRRVQTLNRLFDVVKALQIEQPLEQALVSIGLGIQEATPFQVVLFSLYQPETGTLIRSAAVGIPEPVMNDLRSHPQLWTSTQTFLNDEYRIHDSFFIPIEREPVVPEDVHMVTVLPSITHREPDTWDPDDMLLVPLYNTAGQPLGLISLDAPSDNRRPDRATIEAVEIFATQSALVIEDHIRLNTVRKTLESYQLASRQLEQQILARDQSYSQDLGVLSEFSRRIHNLKTSRVPDELLKTIQQVIPAAQAGFVTLWDPANLSLVTRAARGYKNSQALLRLQYPVGGAEASQSQLIQVFLRGQARRIEESKVAQLFNFAPEDHKIYQSAIGEQLPRSSLLVPVRAGEANIGLLVLDNFRTPVAFSLNDEILAVTLAQQATLGLEKERWAQAVNTRSGQLQALAYVVGILPFITDRQELANITFEQLGMLVPYDLCALWLVTDGEFNLFAKRSSEEREPAIKLGKGEGALLLEEMTSATQPLVINDTEGDPRFSNIGSMACRSWVGLPLLSHGKLFGVITLEKVEADVYTSEHLQLAAALAGALAVALDNARLMEITQQQEQELENKVLQRTNQLTQEQHNLETFLQVMGEISSSLDVRQVIQRTLGILSDAYSAHQSAVLLGQGNDFEVYYRHPGHAGNQLAENGKPRLLETELSSQAVQQRQPVYHATQPTGEENLPDDPTGILAIPLILGEEALGALLIYSAQAPAAEHQANHLAEAIARQISIAIKNNELFTLIRDQSLHLGQLLRDQQIDANRSQAILEAVADGVLATDASGCITFINKSALQILELTPAQVSGMPLERLASGLGDSAKGWTETIQTWAIHLPSNQGGDTYQGRFTLQSGRIVGVHLAPILWRSRFLGTVSVFRDITQEVMVNRMKSDFVANVSHELRTPMTSIKGYVEVLLMGVAGTLNEQQTQSLKIVRNNTERLRLLVDDLLDVSRIDGGQVSLQSELLDLRVVCEDVVEEFRRRSQREGKSMEFCLETPAGLPPVQADRQRLGQVVSNLIGNAYFYTPPEGKIVIRIHLEGEELQVDVVDNGIGILPHLQPRLFERFFRGDDPLVLATPGTGLGLSIVKSLVEMHGGRLWMESSGKRGEGSRFSFTLPFQEGA